METIFKTHKESSIGYKVLSDPEKKTLTHFGLFSKTLDYIKENKLVSFFVSDTFSGELICLYDLIKLSSGGFGPPKIRSGSNKLEKTLDSVLYESVVKKSKEIINSFGVDNEWQLMWFGLEDNRLVFVLYKKDSKQFIELTKIIGDNTASGTITQSDPRFNKIVQYVQFEYNQNCKRPDNTGIEALKEKDLRRFALESVKYLFKIYGNDFLIQNSTVKEAISSKKIKYKTYLFKKYFTQGLFFSFENKPIRSNGKDRPRYIPENINLLNQKFIYISTEWSFTGKSNLLFHQLVKFIEGYSNGEYTAVGDGGITQYRLIKISLINNFSAINKIYFGAPGTGKSTKTNEIIKGLDKKYYERITFHPEFDNTSFVGGYKPSSEIVKEKHEIKYEFVPQSFTNIYLRAWLDLNNPYYLIIEEINRGNCAEIFADIFQLLDRFPDGTSKYPVTPSKELKEHIERVLKTKDHKGIKDGLNLPPNLSILATMNTSDQSLLPMDSAFKRRWEWEYVPIRYEEFIEDTKLKNRSYFFEVEVGKAKFSWIKFIETVNDKISKNPNLGMDKCLGNYFVDVPEPNILISIETFINKVVFYLWNDVFKDEYGEDGNTIFVDDMTFMSFFPSKNANESLVKVVNSLSDYRKNRMGKSDEIWIVNTELQKDSKAKADDDSVEVVTESK